MPVRKATAGDGGIIRTAGSAGGAGTISLTSSFSDVTGTGSVIADGGNVINSPPEEKPTPVMTGGHGGMGGANGKGGNGGAAGDGPGAVIKGGNITVKSLTGISLANYQANGGSVIGAFDAVGGKGGDDVGGGVGDTGGGTGGGVGNNGSGGNGGDISLTTGGGDITIGTLSAIGGSVGDMSAIGGEGGNQQSGRRQRRRRRQCR